MPTLCSRESAYAKPLQYLFSVPKGQERIRICLHAANTAEEIDGLVNCIVDWSKSDEAQKVFADDPPTAKL